MSIANLTTLGTAPDLIIPPYPVRRFSVAEYFELVEQGFFAEREKCELLEGWIVPKMGKNPPHDNTIDILLGLLSEMLQGNWFVRVQNVLEAPESAPEPDLAIVRGKRGNFASRHPQGADVGLVIEVSHATLSVDRRKAVIYARAGVPVYWIVNLKDKCLEIFESPSQRPNGSVEYAPPRIVRRGETIDLILDKTVVGQIDCRQVFGEA